MDHVTDIESALPDTMGCGEDESKTVTVEVCQKISSTVRRGGIRGHVTKMLQQQSYVYGELRITEFEDTFLTEHVISVVVCCNDEQNIKPVDLSCAKLDIHVYQLHDEGPGSEELEEDDLSAAQHWIMPCTEFDGIWESLVFDAHIKTELLQYAMTTLLFSDKKVDCNIISWNRVVLLHGPPGTGKTSLCKALAQKLCIQLSNRYSYGQLIEINSHSLFSKWFSESGKLVMKMFQKIQELIDDPDALVCVLIDEVESLTAARKSSLSGNEPSDAIRVVNALLTQIDQIKRNSNVIILTTSNVTGAIDLAFVDRADIKQYIGPPSTAAIYKIYQSCLKELIRTGIISPAEQVLDLRSLELMKFAENGATQASLQLRQIAIKSQSLSGRTLRKLPFLAHAVYIKKQTATLEEFLVALDKAVDKQFQDRSELTMD